MIARLEFDLSDYDDQIAHRRCLRANDLRAALNEINEIIRKRVKYGYLSEAAQDEAEKIRDEINGVIDNRELWRLLDE